jgi:predicted transcriptional regulator
MSFRCKPQVQVVLGLTDTDAVVSGELLEQANSLAQQTIPPIAMGVVQGSIAVSSDVNFSG